MTDRLHNTDGHEIYVAKHIPYPHPHGPLREVSIRHERTTILKLTPDTAVKLAHRLLSTVYRHNPSDPHGMRAEKGQSVQEAKPVDDSDTYPAEWLDIVPDPLDPRLGDAVEVWEPSDNERARALELWSSYASRDPAFAALFQIWCDDVLRERNLPSMMIAILEHGTVSLIGCQGEELTIKRLDGAVEAARDDAIGETE